MAGSRSAVFVRVVLHETDKAWQFGIGDEVRWVPKSVVTAPDDMEVGDEDVDVEIEDWFRVKEGIET